MDQLKDDPATSEILGRPGTMTLAIAQDRRLVYYPCVNNTIMNCLFIHPSSESRAEGQGESLLSHNLGRLGRVSLANKQ